MTAIQHKLKKIDGTYHVAVHASGKTKWIPTGCDTQAEAEKVIAESGVERLSLAAKAGRLTHKAVGQILTGRDLTCREALEEFKKQRSVSQASKTVANNILVISKWLKDAGIESLPPSEVTPQHIGAWINDKNSKWKRSTRQSALAIVRNFCRFCADTGWITSDPSQLVELDDSVMAQDQKGSGDKQPFTEEEVRRLLEALHQDWRLSETKEHELCRDPMDVGFWLVAVSVAKETGLRLSDIAQLQWRSFQETGKLITWIEKTNRRMELPISQELFALISEVVPANDTDYLFPAHCAAIRDVNRRSKLSVQFARMLRQLGINNRSFHSLRNYNATHNLAKMDKATLAAKLAEVLTLEQIVALLVRARSKTSKG